MEMNQSEVCLEIDPEEQQKSLEDIGRCVCALRNNGGILELRTKSNALNGLKRRSEQKIEKLIGPYDLCKKAKYSQENNGKLIFDFVKADSLCTLNYNLHLPSETQIISIPPTEKIEKVKEILTSNEVPTKIIGCHHKRFIQNKKVEITESKEIQLKKIKSEKSKNFSIHQRMVKKCNKLKSTVSAFANLNGGHIYYGITDDEVVTGEVVDEKEKENIISSVMSTIESMIWPAERKPKKGEVWDIHFEPVKDEDSNPIPFTFVIVISVASCPGGVFAEEPESYHMVEGEVKRMPFDVWKSNFLCDAPLGETIPTGKTRAAIQSTTSTTKSAVDWSSEGNQEIYQELNEKLDRLRENGEWDKFWNELENLASTNDTIIVQLIVIFQRVCAAYMQKRLKQANKFRKEFKKLIEKSRDSRIFEVEALFMKSAIRRFEEQYEESYWYLSRAVELEETLPRGLTTAWVYCTLATVCIILANKRGNRQESRKRYEREAHEHCRKSLEHAEDLNKIPIAKSDLNEVIFINKIFLELRSSITGDGLYFDAPLTIEEINSVKNNLRKRLKCIQNINADTLRFNTTLYNPTCTSDYHNA